MTTWPLTLSQADTDDMPAILGLIHEAASWLASRNTDQWAAPWPDEEGLHVRVRAALRQGRSWICWDNTYPAATITADPQEDPYWSPADRGEPAIYVHRLVVSRYYAGADLGGALLDWAGRTGQRNHGARWLRLSAWTTNHDLHAYYRRHGFSLMELRPDPAYPSGACFQKPTAMIPDASSPLFRLAERR
jgi:ribosomal protein S18 acetylase RimI-like enzyme